MNIAKLPSVPRQILKDIPRPPNSLAGTANGVAIPLVPALRLSDGRLGVFRENFMAENMVPSGMRLEFGGAISGNMRLSFHAARSIG